MALPASTHIGKVVLQIADLDRSLGFYRDVIGFRLLDRTDAGERVAHLGVHGSDVVWLELHEKRGVAKIPRRGLIGLYHFAVLLPTRPHLGRFLVNAVNAGAHVASADHLVSEALYLVDPDGITIEVYQDRPQSEWRRSASGELELATLPLNVDQVVEAGSSAPQWSGLPEGTTMGHMHFYVADLAAADAFYIGTLGFDAMLRSFPGALFVSAGGYHHHVGLNIWAARTRVATTDDAKLLWWELVVPGTTEPKTLTDPWGIEVRIVQGGS